MIKGIACVCVAFAMGSAAKAIDAYAGEGTTRAGVGAGFTQMGGMLGEVAEVPANVMSEVKPGLQGVTSQMGDVLGGATGSTLPPSQDAPAAPAG